MARIQKTQHTTWLIPATTGNLVIFYTRTVNTLF